MSQSTCEANSGSPSKDIWSGKRSVEDDENPIGSGSKRVRRGASSPRVEEELVQDFIVVSSRKAGREDSHPPDQGVSISQSSSRVSSPLSSAPSRMTDDCGEMAQKAMEAWTSGLANVNANELNPVTGDATTASLPPNSPQSSIRGVDQPREWLESQKSSIEKPFRTPLPANKESRHPDESTGLHDSMNRQHLEQQRSWSSQPTDAAQVSTSLSTRMDVSSLAASDETPRPLPKESDQSNSPWYSRDESRQLPPLPGLNTPLAGPRRDSLTQSLDGQRASVPIQGSGGLEGGLEGRLNTFSSNFSVLTTDAVQRNQASGGRIGKRRGRKPAGMPGSSRLDERALGSRIDVEDGYTTSVARDVRSIESKNYSHSPPSRHLSNNSQPFPSANVIPQVVSSQASTPPVIAARPFQPPPVTFTLDNNVETLLPREEVQTCIDSFKQNAGIVLLPILDQEARPYPIEMIMWQRLFDFYTWFGEHSKSKEIGPLMFELLDVHWQEERSFVVPEGSLSYYRIIKQYIWDFYWLATNINKGPTRFRVLVKRFIPHAQASPDAYSQRPYSNPQSRPVSRHMRQLPDPLSSVVSRPISPSRRAGISPRTTILNSPPRSIHNHPNSRAETTQPAPGSPNIGQYRTEYDRAMLRERAQGFINNRQDVVTLDHESTVLDKLPYKTGSEVCGVVIDKRSGNGMVAVTGKGYITVNVKTGTNEPGDRYQEVTIQPKQTCMLHGGAVVLFYKRRSVNAPPQPSFWPENLGQSQRPRTGSDVDITVRLQIDGNGKYSHPFDKSVLRPKVTILEFFSWFANQSGHCLPQGPPILKFTFKDAMPAPKSTEIARGNEDHFMYMRKDVKVQCEKAKKYMEDLKEFVILVTVPGWTGLNVDDEDEW